MTKNITIQIFDYESIHQPWFEKFNRAWIEKYFWMEPIDVDVLQRPDEHIIAKGGTILMASADKEIAGTVALKYSAPGVYEFTKMAVTDKFQGLKIGRALSQAAIEKARSLGAKKIILYSHTSLVNAIGLYRSLGFIEVPVDGPYKRSDIKMELELQDDIIVSLASQADIPALVKLGVETFRETFGNDNTSEDMDAYVHSAFTSEKFLQEFLETETRFFIARDGERIVGYAKVRAGEQHAEFNNVRAIELHRLYVDKGYFGKGVSKQLMTTCLNYARQAGYEWIWLGVWEHNGRAIAFYRKSGFEKFGDHVFVLGNDPQTDWLMKKKIV